MKTIGILRRWSTPLQNEGYRNQIQVEDMIRRVESLGYEYWLYDEGQVSGQRMSKRKVFLQLLSDLKSRKIHGLAALDIKRITRDRVGVERSTIKEILMETGAILITLDQVIDLGNNHNDALIYDVFGALAGFEITTIRNTFWQGNIRRRLVGPATNGSKPPFGYEHQVLRIRSNGKAERQIVKSSDPSRQSQVLALFDIAATAPTYSFVAREMNKRGYWFVGNGGKLVPWQQINAKTAIHNPIYSGRLGIGKFQMSDVWRLNEETKHGTSWREEPSLAYIDVATQDYIIERLQPQGRRPSRSVGAENPLLGILRCPSCGGQMYMTHLNSKRKDSSGDVVKEPYQYCKVHSWSEGHCPNGTMLKQEKVLEAIFAFLDSYVEEAIRDGSLATILTDTSSDEETIHLQNTEAFLEKKLKNTMHLLASMSEDEEDAENWIVVLKETRQELRAAREAIKRAAQASQSQHLLESLTALQQAGELVPTLLRQPWHVQKDWLEMAFSQIQVSATGRPGTKRRYEVSAAWDLEGAPMEVLQNSDTSSATSMTISNHCLQTLAMLVS